MGTITRSFANLITASGPSALPSGVASNTPAFHAQDATNTSVANSTWTKMSIPTEIFDTDNCYSSSRFTPTTSGKYFIYGCLKSSTDTDFDNLGIRFYKNGSAVDPLVRIVNQNVNSAYMAFTIELNGTSDYVEMFGLQNSGGTLDLQGLVFGGYKLIGA